MERQFRRKNKILTLYITNRCNFKCKTCLREYRPYKDLQKEVLEDLLPQAKRLGYFRVAFTGGEPCLHPQFKEFVQVIIDNNMTFGLVSNGSLLKEYEFVIKEFKEHLDYATFSLDGATADVHDLVRQQGSFEKVVESIKYFLSKGIYTKAIMCVNKLNMHQVEDVVNLADSLGVKELLFTSAISTSLNKSIVLSDKEKIKYASLIMRLKKRHDMPLSVLSALQAVPKIINFCKALSYTYNLAVNPNGEVMFCCDTIRDGAVMGSLKETRLVDLFCKIQDVTAELKKVRARMINERKITSDFNTCEFCNNRLSDYIKIV